jgi:crotonobetainyl-CoA:carnitine CoA-transferase CaiB-like acyl-CoA transferase
MTHRPAPVAPLSGVRVIELGDSPAVAMCGKLLVGLGADVVVAGGGGLRRFGEDALAQAAACFLDGAKGAVARAALDQLPDWDILLTSEEPADGGGAQAWVDRAPQLICAHFTRFGERGPYHERPGSELVVQAAGGLLALLGDPQREPLMLPGHQAAYSTGLSAFTAVMAALTTRDRPGAEVEGQVIELSEFETIAFLEWKGPVYYQASGTIVPRGRETGPLVLPCRDGHLAFFYNPSDWPKLVELFGSPPELVDPRFGTQAGRIAAEPELRTLLSTLTLSRGKHELYHAAQARGVPVGSVETIDDLLVSPQYDARNFLRPAAPGGSVAMAPSLPFTFNGVRVEDLALPAGATDPIFERSGA